MLGRLKAICKSLPLKLLLWAGASLIIAIALAINIIHIGTLPAKETLYANTHQQRAIIDPTTGAASVGSQEKSAAFDVGKDVGKEGITAPENGDNKNTAPRHEAVAPLPKDLPSLRSTPETTQIPVVPHTDISLVRAPAPDLTEKAGDLTLPKRSTGAGAPSTIYSRGFTRTKDQHLLAVIITDAGFSTDSLASILTLPKDVGVAVTPYASDTGKQIEALRNSGFEVWSMLPTQEERYPQEDPGPLGILTTMSQSEMLGRVHAVMANTIGSVGVVLPPGQQLSKIEKLWHALRAELEGRGMLLLLTRVTPETQTLTSDMAQLNIRGVDVILDSTPSEAFIRSKLSLLLDQAKTHSITIVSASARPQTIVMLREWLRSLPPTITIAPVSAVYKPESKEVEGGMSEKERSEKLIQRRGH